MKGWFNGILYLMNEQAIARVAASPLTLNWTSIDLKTRKSIRAKSSL